MYHVSEDMANIRKHFMH